MAFEHTLGRAYENKYFQVLNNTWAEFLLFPLPCLCNRPLFCPFSLARFEEVLLKPMCRWRKPMTSAHLTCLNKWVILAHSFWNSKNDRNSGHEFLFSLPPLLTDCNMPTIITVIFIIFQEWLHADRRCGVLCLTDSGALVRRQPGATAQRAGPLALLPSGCP